MNQPQLSYLAVHAVPPDLLERTFDAPLPREVEDYARACAALTRWVHRQVGPDGQLQLRLSQVLAIIEAGQSAASITMFLAMQIHPCECPRCAKGGQG